MSNRHGVFVEIIQRPRIGNYVTRRDDDNAKKVKKNMYI